MTHEIRVGAGHIGCRNDKTVAAAAHEHLFQPVGDLLGAADDRVCGLATTAESEKIPCARIGLAAGLALTVAYVDLLGAAYVRVCGFATTAESDKIPCARIGLAAGPEHTVADADHALHALQFFGRQRLLGAPWGQREGSAFPP